jgi:putative DNA primase/helicase
LSRPTNISEVRRRKPNWELGIIRTKEGQPKRGIANTMHVLSCHPAWDGVVAYDGFNEQVVKLQPPPTREQDGQGAIGEWGDTDTARTVAWFASSIGFEPSAEHVDSAVGTVAETRTFHPVRAYLEPLVWDGAPRCDMFLSRYFGAEQNNYAAAVGTRWLISAVARVMQPGCQADCMLVLEGEQGIGKSTGLEALFSKLWFADSPVAIGEKDGFQSLRGRWCIEFGELQSFRGRDVTTIKSFVSARSDNYRPSYSRRTRAFQRQVIFAGTTNEDAYLGDKSGNRRFWPVRCSKVDVAALTTDRDQIWAEAFTRYSNGEAWHIDTPELRALCEQAQESREIDDPWVHTIARWLEEPTFEREHGRQPDRVVISEGLSLSQIMTHALRLSAGELARQDLTTRAGHVMRRLGWNPKQLRRAGVRVRLYFPPRPSQLSLAEAGEQP